MSNPLNIAPAARDTEEIILVGVLNRELDANRTAQNLYQQLRSVDDVSGIFASLMSVLMFARRRSFMRLWIL